MSTHATAGSAPSSSPASNAKVSPARKARSEENQRNAEIDRGLVSRFLAGDESAFVEITERHREKIFSVALSLLRNRADADEIVQDTFLRAYRGLERFRGDSSLATWLNRIAVNLSRNRYWFYCRRGRNSTLSLDARLGSETTSDFSELLACDKPSPVGELAAVEFTTLITDCIEKLEASHREILTLRGVLNHSYEDIAAALGIEPGTVKSRIARARGKLRSLLAEACPEFSPGADPSEWFEYNRPASRLVAAS